MNTVTVICLTCRTSGNALPCAHRKIRCRDARAPRKSAGRYRWEAFVEFLNARVGSGMVYDATTGERITGRVTL